jgi:hypothetical protein
MHIRIKIGQSKLIFIYGGTYMKKAGFITSAIIGVIGIAGAGYALSDGRFRKKLCRQGRKMMEKAGDAIDNFTSKY